ncbi:MAG TPA: hypothetical protein VGJ03_11700 [Acidimicrobiales bacterium]
MAIDPTKLAQAQASPRWVALTRGDLDLGTAATWDPTIVRESRVLVPVDVQALYVPTGDAEAMVRLPSAVSAPDGDPPPVTPPPFDPGTPRPAGVHLHWAPPDALLNGTMADRADGDRNRLGLPPLPDRWAVVRVLRPVGSAVAAVRGWLVAADTAAVAPFEDPTNPGAPGGSTIAAADLHGTVGGSLTWAGTYDATVNRLAFHDPLDDLAAVAPNGIDGPDGGVATYLVAGWWSGAERDPLDVARTQAGLHDRLAALGWSLLEDAEGGDLVDVGRASAATERARFGLATQSRFSLPGAASKADAPKAVAGAMNVLPSAGPFEVRAAALASEAQFVLPSEPTFPRSTLLHGVVFGVPVAGPVPAGLDPRPDPATVQVALGHHGDDVAAALVSLGLGVVDPEQRRDLERVLGAFTGHLLTELGTRDGVVDIEEHEHAAGFAARNGGVAAQKDTLVRGDRTGGLGGGARGRSALATSVTANAASGIQKATLRWKGDLRTEMAEAPIGDLRRRFAGLTDQVFGAAAPGAEVAEVPRPLPRFHMPAPPVVGLRGPRRSLRYRGDGRHSPDNLLQCRWPSQVVTSYQHVLDGADIVPTLGCGAVPDEVLALTREATVIDPYASAWLGQAAASHRPVDPHLASNRLLAEAVLHFGADATYDATASAVAGALQPGDALTARGVDASIVSDELRRFSLAVGAHPDPVAVTAWAQPWVPLWLEWELRIAAGDRFDGWTLGAVDLDPPADSPAPPTARVMSGRSALTTGVATTLGAAIDAWRVAEDQRDTHNEGEADQATEDALAAIAGVLEGLDVLGASLDGVREQLLGLPYADGLAHDASGLGPAPTAAPQLVVAGSLALTRARLLDAFGRTLDLDVAATRLPLRDELPPPAAGQPPELRIRPRLQVPARWLFRLVDPAAVGPDVASAAEAFVDQSDPARMVNPVAGFLLPDHIDEELEVFDVTGAPIGALGHEPFGGGVTWEIAPGRSGPADAGPLYGLSSEQDPLGHFAAGLVAADVTARGGRVRQPETDSALSALLRVLDTTLWTVDTFAALGTDHIAGLVGRPMAVVRARLSLDLDDDLDEIDLTAAGARDARAAAYAALADRAYPVRLGELTRSDDGLLAYFVDDDFCHVHVVDKVLETLAPDSGRQRGQLGPYGETPRVPPPRPIDHPYLSPDDGLVLHLGQTVGLTLLLLPAGRVHLTSGVLPRKHVQLARDWVAPGLAVMAPSVRIGPVLIDPGNVQLPKVSSFPKEQRFTRRDTPNTWKDDPILAATQTALLPDLPHEVQEGYIRVAPPDPGAGQGGTAPTTGGAGA